MTAFFPLYWLCHKQINANSSWHLSDRVKDLHISTDAHLAGQVAPHYWYGVHKAKDKCNSLVYKTSKWGTARDGVSKIIVWGIALHCLQPANLCVCTPVWTSYCSETHKWQSIFQQEEQFFSLWNDEQWHLGFGVLSALCGPIKTDGVLLVTLKMTFSTTLNP